jgi:hypothetical protein
MTSHGGPFLNTFDMIKHQPTILQITNGPSWNLLFEYSLADEHTWVIEQPWTDIYIPGAISC